jgi:DNA-binding response OmpR family regulator
VIDMDHDDGAALLQAVGLSRSVSGAVTPVIELTRRGDLRTKLRAFDLGVDDILTVPFSPEELLARSMVVSRRASGSDRPIVPVIRLGEMEIDIVHRQVRTGTSSCTSAASGRASLYLLASRAGRAFRGREQHVDRHVRALRA